jgi:cytochrome c peroxidase
MNLKPVLLLALCAFFVSCNDDSDYVPLVNYPAVTEAFGDKIDLNNLSNYASQFVPAYITRDNTAANPVTDRGATLGRVLFYDKNLSSDNTVSCATCHIQADAFGDSRLTSTGVNGETARHAMRLINARYGNESRFFWDERAATLELQTTQPIRNHAEMGFSGDDGAPDINVLVAKLQDIPYYQNLFEFVYGDSYVTEERMQLALAQFVRSITSFDSKYDLARTLAPNNNVPFQIFTQQENQGKNLFNAPPVFDANGNRTGGGLGCAGCHAAPEFDINPNIGNNGIVGSIGNPDATETGNTRAPSLRDIMKQNGSFNGPFMHTGEFVTLDQVLAHYNNITLVPNLDQRLRPAGNPQHLNLTVAEIDAVKAFLQTLSGTNVYTDPKWASPFSQ